MMMDAIKKMVKQKKYAKEVSTHIFHGGAQSVCNTHMNGNVIMRVLIPPLSHSRYFQ